jgi:hypothetical protein
MIGRIDMRATVIDPIAGAVGDVDAAEGGLDLFGDVRKGSRHQNGCCDAAISLFTPCQLPQTETCGTPYFGAVRGQPGEKSHLHGQIATANNWA